MQLQFTINDKSFTLRSAVESDDSLLLYWWNDGEIMAHAGFPLGLKTTIEKVKENIAKNNENYQLLIIICDDIPIGEINFRAEDKIFEFGIKICNKTYQNNGYGTEILKHLFHYLFTERNAEKIKCDTNLKNIRSQMVYEKKLKMKRVETLYNCWTNQIGELCSATVFEISKDDYLVHYNSN